MISLSSLKNATRKHQRRKLLGRGPGSGSGKTSGRGHKGAGSRAGSKRRWGYEGGQMRLHMKLPTRGFSNVRFRNNVDSVNLMQIERHYKDGEVVNTETLMKKSLISSHAYTVKILGEGTLTKKVSIHVDALSSGARKKIQEAKIEYKLTGE